ncbi:MAG: hypothetical protein RL291_1471 [Pseudomonadota bacterium]|jgi:uncharacterized integral membrane protein
MLRRIAWFLFAIPAGLLLIVAMFANKHWVTLNLDPFRELDDSTISIKVPLYGLIMLSMIAGVLLGGMATWFKQGRWRKTARKRGLEAMRWEEEAGRLSRERDALVHASTNGDAITSRNVARLSSR